MRALRDAQVTIVRPRPSQETLRQHLKTRAEVVRAFPASLRLSAMKCGEIKLRFKKRTGARLGTEARAQTGFSASRRRGPAAIERDMLVITFLAQPATGPTGYRAGTLLPWRR